MMTVQLVNAMRSAGLMTNQLVRMNIVVVPMDQMVRNMNVVPVVIFHGAKDDTFVAMVGCMNTMIVVAAVMLQVVNTMDFVKVNIAVVSFHNVKMDVRVVLTVRSGNTMDIAVVLGVIQVLNMDIVLGAIRIVRIQMVAIHREA
jgi:hypothetical protein